VIAVFVLATFPVALLAGAVVSRYPAAARMVAVWPALLAVMLSAALLASPLPAGHIVEMAWAPSLGLTLSFNLDGLGLLFALLIAAVGALVVVYASAYLENHAHPGRFYASLFAFMGAMLGVALSDNILTLFVFWELTGFTSFLLIGFEHERADARSAALQALIVTGAGGLALLAAGVLLVDISGTSSLSTMAARGGAIAADPWYVVIMTLVLAAAFTKSAQVPFHFWLPNAMAAPTPVSAYLHSATMVKAGVYLIARMTPILGGTALWMAVVTAVGAVTMLVGAYRSVQETDLKRILAYSTVSALGLMTMLLGVGTQQAIAGALVYLVTHACYKGALFLVAGAIDHQTGSRDIRTLSGLRESMPLTALAGVAAAVSMAGVPLTFGFIAKDGAYEALLGGGMWWLLATTVIASMLLGQAGLVAGLLPFHGSSSIEAREGGWRLWFPPLVLASAGVIAGIAPWALNVPLSGAAATVVRLPTSLSLAIWHGLSPALLLSVFTLLGVALAYWQRDVIRARAWNARLSADLPYTGGVSALNRISGIIGPPLHSASLRSYVMVIVLVTVIIAGVALATVPGIGSAAAQTSVRLHEVMVVIVIIAGAISATVAKSTMGAVLSLGVVGYGVAITFLLYGAPDLAMTQFSVETLTVIIYVLVFRHFRNLGPLSPPLVRFRDFAIGAANGILIGALVLSVSTTATAARLREYFVEFGPTLGHGRNIVNVILVDFRGFDTMGEITVLATAAIGVRALLRIAAPDRGTQPSHEMPVTSAIFRTGARYLMPLLLLFAVFLLARGHNEPGGGFVGGLVAAAAFALYLIAYGVQAARQLLRIKPMTLLATGLSIALLSGVPAVVRGQPFMTAQWTVEPVHIGTPVLFDVGVFLVVSGVVLMMIFSLAEES
jgi:multicomponent Na+:H+ antiporter subunit A